MIEFPVHNNNEHKNIHRERYRRMIRQSRADPAREPRRNISGTLGFMFPGLAILAVFLWWLAG